MTYYLRKMIKNSGSGNPGIFLTMDPGSGMEKFGFRIRDKHPRSAALI
jgi:hypothetical protein